MATTFEYATDLFDEQTIVRFQEHLKLLLELLVENPECKIADIQMLTSKEKAFLLRTPAIEKSAFSEFKGIHEAIIDFAKKKPTSIAAIYDEDRLTYEAAYKKALDLQPIILNYSKGENKIVGLAVDRSVDMVIGILAILNAGCAYMPIDLDYPKQRIDFMLQDAKVGLVLTQDEYKSDFELSGVSTISIDKDSAEAVSQKLMPREPKEDDLAYVIYTSGSTGNPKGVPITHKSIINSTAGRLNYYEESPSVFLLMSSIAFDSSKAGIFWTLCTGGTLLITEKRIEQDIEKLCNIVFQEKVTHTLMLPSLYRLLLEYGEVNKLGGLHSVIVAGESCPPALGSMHFDKLPKTRLYNEYGPTEATVWCTAHQLLKDHSYETVPIGKPVANASIFLLDKNFQLVPYGAIGDLYIGGVGLAGLYLNRPELTEKMYVNNPYSETGSDYLYKTGDKGRYNSDGELEFLGRSDQQIKIRGFRVELEEIERAILKNKMVAEAVVMLHQKSTNQDTGVQQDGVKFLVAYVIPADLSYDERLLRHELKQIIPEYMVPASFVELSQFPLLPNGKIDKKALKKMKSQVEEKKKVADDKPLDPIQKKLVTIWEEVLNHSPVTISDNFFELGGDSISSIQIIAKARKAGLQLKANQLFDSQTIEELSLFVKSESPKVIAMEILVGEVPLTPIQHWFFEIHKSAPHYWNQIVRISNIETVPVSVIESITKALVSFHDALRTAFVKVENNWKAKVLSLDEINSFHFYNVGNCKNLREQDEEIDEIMVSLQQECDLSSGNLFRALYFDCGEIQANKVFLLAHHLVTDMVSWNAIFDDFSKAIQQIQLGKEIEFKTKTASIRDWSKHLHELSNSEDIRKELDFWKAQNADCQVLPTDFEVSSEMFSEKSLKLLTSIIPKEETTLLLTSANNALNTKIEDLMLTALVTTFCEWGKVDGLCLGLERHGRNVDNEVIDVSNTVGWFTSFFPIRFQKTQSDDIGESIKLVKEHLRAIPNDGIGFGILKYLSDNDQLDFAFPKLVFNYLGVIGNSHSDSEIRYNFQARGNHDALSERTSTIDINVFVSDDKIHMNWSYSHDAYREETISKLIKAYMDNLKEITDYCVAKVESDYTPSDFPESGLDQDDLDELMKLL